MTVSIQWSKDHRITALAVVLLPVLLVLGSWQLQRAEEKQEILDKIEERRRQAPQALAELDSEADLAFQSVTLRGRYDNEHTFLLDNRVHRGRVGYDVLSPFVDYSDGVVLVNRGWIRAGRTRAQLPEVPSAVDTEIVLTAEIYVPPQGMRWLENDSAGGSTWPRVVQLVDTQELGAQLGVVLFPFEVRIGADQVGALATGWTAVNVSPEKHRAYAVQWFAMAAALLLWHLLANTNLRSLLRKRAPAEDGGQ